MLTPLLRSKLPIELMLWDALCRGRNPGLWGQEPESSQISTPRVHWSTVKGPHHSRACSSTYAEVCNNTNQTISPAVPAEVVDLPKSHAREWWLFHGTILALFSIAFALGCCQKQSKKANFCSNPNRIFYLLILMGIFPQTGMPKTSSHCHSPGSNYCIF